MKLEGKIGQLRRILEKTSCKGLFEPITLVMRDDMITTKMVYEGMQCGAFLKFEGIDVDAEDEEKLTLNGKSLLDHIAPIPDDHPFTAEVKDGNIEIETPKETVYYHLQVTDEDTENLMDNMPLVIEEGRIFLQGDGGRMKFSTKVSTDSAEFRNIISRMKINDAEFISLEEDGGDMQAIIGSLTSRKKHPRIYNMDAEVEESKGEGEKTTVAVGADEISTVLEGDIEIHYSNKTPMVIFDQNESDEDGEDGYQALYIISPAQDVE